MTVSAVSRGLRVIGRQTDEGHSLPMKDNTIKTEDFHLIKAFHINWK